eukprot:11275292-Ditylum_brightwellii.AAC.1
MLFAVYPAIAANVCILCSILCAAVMWGLNASHVRSAGVRWIHSLHASLCMPVEKIKSYVMFVSCASEYVFSPTVVRSYTLSIQVKSTSIGSMGSNFSLIRASAFAIIAGVNWP